MPAGFRQAHPRRRRRQAALRVAPRSHRRACEGFQLLAELVVAHRLERQKAGVGVGGSGDDADLEQVELVQLVGVVGLFFGDDHVAEAQAHRPGLHRAPCLAALLGTVEVNLARDLEAELGLLHRGRVDRADDVLGLALVVPVQRHLLARSLPALDRLGECARNDPVAGAVDRVGRGEGDELTGVGGRCGLRLKRHLAGHASSLQVISIKHSQPE